MKAGENPAHRKAKVSRATLIVPGLVGPKARPDGVVDGSLVDIPEPGSDVEYVGTLLWGHSRRWLSALEVTPRTAFSDKVKLAKEGSRKSA